MQLGVKHRGGAVRIAELQRQREDGVRARAGLVELVLGDGAVRLALEPGAYARSLKSST